MSHNKMEKLLRKQTLATENIETLWQSAFHKAKEGLTLGICKSYLEQLVFRYDRFCQTDAKLSDRKDFVTTEYYNKDVATDVLSRYVTIKDHMSSRRT